MLLLNVRVKRWIREIVFATAALKVAALVIVLRATAAPLLLRQLTIQCVVTRFVVLRLIAYECRNIALHGGAGKFLFLAIVIDHDIVFVDKVHLTFHILK